MAFTVSCLRQDTLPGGGEPDQRALDFVQKFLDELSVGPGSTPGLRESQAQWREKIKGLLR
jgi:hypothetical protein